MITKITLNNITVFSDLSIDFCDGINILIGENGTGKTHLMKFLYAACQSANKRISFPHKIVMTMLPDDYNISRLLTRKTDKSTGSIYITAKEAEKVYKRMLQVSFNGKTKKWAANVTGEVEWEKSFSGLKSIFIPTKEILSNSYNLTAAVAKNNIRVDDTYLDIIDAAKVDISNGENSDSKNAILKKIQEIIHGTVVYDIKKDEFYLKIRNSKQEFNMVAEGIRKMALLWQLVKNGVLEKNAVLFWDNPETNLNPKYISVLADILLMLQRDGVQIFIATHNLFLPKLIDMRKQDNDKIMYHSLYWDRNLEEICLEQKDLFIDLNNNSIIEIFKEL